MGSQRSWFRLPFVYRPRAERQSSPELVAIHWHGTTPRENRVANISNSGAYLWTNESWNPGELLSLTLQRGGSFEPSKRGRFTVQARAVRRDKNGVGIAFLFSRGEDLRLWEDSSHPSVLKNEPEDLVREFRIAAALAFLHRISPASSERVDCLFRRGLSSHRLEGAIEIALHAEDLLTVLTPRTSLCADPDVVLRILEEGSWTEVDWIQHYWSGLLVSAGVDHAPSEPNSDAPGLLSQLTTMQARIFASACETSRKFIDPDGQLVAQRLTRSADDLVKISDTHDRVHIERDVHHLVQLGLLEPKSKWIFFSPLEQADITPTATALSLYARCHAHFGELADFYGIEATVESAYARATGD